MTIMREKYIYIDKISAQPHTTLCIQFLNREKNDKNNTLPLRKQICFTMAWGCAEILPWCCLCDFPTKSLSVLELIKLREIWDYFHYQNKVILLYLLVQKFKLKSFHLNWVLREFSLIRNHPKSLFLSQNFQVSDIFAPESQFKLETLPPRCTVFKISFAQLKF